MVVLVACEESQRVCTAFREQGHIAFSCDILECSGGHPEWHIKQDVLPLLNGNCYFTTETGVEYHIFGKWDLIIAHPPCTDLCCSGARWFERKIADGSQVRSVEFFMRFVNADCDHIAIENPVGIMSSLYRKPDQIVHPWMWGDKASKATCLWLKNLPCLVPAVKARPELEWVYFPNPKTGKIAKMPKWYADAWNLSKKECARIRSQTFPGIAKVMAEQWGGIVK